VHVEDKRTTLRVEDAQRSDCGRYMISLFNPAGEESATAMVVVVGKPTPPSGPLEVKEVTREGCVLCWDPPGDDGGEPVEGMFYLNTCMKYTL